MTTLEHGRERHRESLMLAKWRALSSEGKANVTRLIDELRETEEEAAYLHGFGASRKAFVNVWDNPDDAEYNDI